MRALFAALGGLVLLLVWWAPLQRMGMGPFATHMTVHMGVVAVAAPLLSLGIAGTRFDPVPRAPGFFAPIPASVVELVVVWACHAPALHLAARHSVGGLLLEQGAFLASGLLVWLSALGGRHAPADRRATGVLALLLTSMHMTLLGALLALAPRPLYAHAHGAHAAHLTPLEDQHLGGAIMLIIGGVSYLLGGVGLSAGLVRARLQRPADPAVSPGAVSSGPQAPLGPHPHGASEPEASRGL